MYPGRSHFSRQLAAYTALQPIQWRCIICWILCFLFATPTLAESAAKPHGIGIEITTYLGDKQTFKQGDTLAFLVSLDKPAHVLMIYQDAQHNLIQIIPNRYRPDNQYPAGLFIAVPNENEPFEFTVKPPYGEEKLWAFASKRPFPTLDGTELQNGLKQLNGELTGILKRLRPRQRSDNYGESSTTIITVAK